MSTISDLDHWPKIVLLGDSITRRAFEHDNGCWASMIAHKVQPYFDVNNRGFDGYNSAFCLDFVPRLFTKSYLKDVSLFVIFLGHNDSWDTKPLRVDPDDFNSNMRSIIDHLLENGLTSDKIILISPGWLDVEEHQKYMKQKGWPLIGKDIIDAQQYAEIVEKISQDYNTSFVDFFKVTTEYGQEKPILDLFCDGIHLNTKGAKLLFEHLWPVMEKKINEQYGKPVDDTLLYHVTPMYKRSEFEPMLAQIMQSLAQAQDVVKE